MFHSYHSRYACQESQGGKMSTVHAITALTQSAEQWLKSHIQSEPWQWYNHTLAVDHRYLEDIKEAIAKASLSNEFHIS
jgi:hypothetical protein